MTLLSRREVLIRLGALTGGAVLGAEFFLSGCRRPDKNTLDGFTAEQVALMDEIADTIIPTTPDSPGAKAAGVGAVMAKVVADCYGDDEHAVFLAGLAAIDAAAEAKFGANFRGCLPEQRKQVLIAAAHQRTAAPRPNAGPQPRHYFGMMKELTLLGYFTSEIGCTQALQYVETPGRYEGDVPYRPGERAWAPGTIRLG